MKLPMDTYRILIVEDHREVSHLLRTSLETLEHPLEVVEIPSGEEAILEASRHRVDLLVADYRLPGISGIELMHKVRQYHPQARVILITGLADPKVRKQVAEAGADSFFLKPVPIADFLDAVERHLGLVKTLLPPEPVDREPVLQEEEARTIADLIIALRQELGAQAVVLLDDKGQVVAQAGALPDKAIETSLFDLLMIVASAGQKVGRLIGQKAPDSWHVFVGKGYDLIFAPLGSNHALLIAGEKLADTSTILDTVAVFSAARPGIEQALGAIVLPAPPPASAEVEVEKEKPAEKAEEAGEEDLEPLFKAQKKIKAEDADSFWEQVAEKHGSAPTKPDVLTYEQARQLGLTPDAKP